MHIIPNIFKIDRSHSKIAELSNSSEIISTIIKSSYNKNKIKLDTNGLSLNKLVKDDFVYYLYSYTVDDKQSDWSLFLPEELKEHNNFSQIKLSLLLFIETEYELFVVVGGSAYWIVASFLDHLFGLITYDRIILLEEDEATSTKSRGLIGQRVGFSEQYRNNYRMINYLQFGKIPKELHIKLATETSKTHFNFLLPKNKERLQIAVGKSFKINREVSFIELHAVLKELCIIMSIAPKDFLSSYIQINDKNLLKKYKEALTIKIYNNISNLLLGGKDSRDDFEFDFCNPNKIQDFYEAERYELIENTESGKKKDGLFATVIDKEDIYKTVIKRAYELKGDNSVGILSYLYGVNVKCYVGKKQRASAGFMFHFNAEFNIDGDAVFLIDSKWYRLKQTFIESLIAQTERVLRNTKLLGGVLDIPWEYNLTRGTFKNEGKYNMLYDGKQDYIVIDTVIIEGVELCDILFIKGNEVYLIHVKHSFTTRVRELTNQILISARRLSEAISTSDNVFFDKIYEQLISKERGINHLTKLEFFNLFMLKKPIYVLATASHLTKDLSIEDNMKMYNSNIARFSLNTCSSEMQTNYYELKTFQIPRLEVL